MITLMYPVSDRQASHLAWGPRSVSTSASIRIQAKVLSTLCDVSAGALTAAGVEQEAVLGMCLGMSGVDREADASALKACLQEWLSQEARTQYAVKHAALSCTIMLAPEPGCLKLGSCECCSAYCGNSLYVLAQVDITVHNDSVIALACGTGGLLHGCVLIVGTGMLLSLHFRLCKGPCMIICTKGDVSCKEKALGRSLGLQDWVHFEAGHHNICCRVPILTRSFL